MFRPTYTPQASLSAVFGGICSVWDPFSAVSTVCRAVPRGGEPRGPIIYSCVLFGLQARLWDSCCFQS